MAQQVRNIAPFINDVFTITSPWWNERINPITGEVESQEIIEEINAKVGEENDSTTKN